MGGGNDPHITPSSSKQRPKKEKEARSMFDPSLLGVQTNYKDPFADSDFEFIASTPSTQGVSTVLKNSTASQSSSNLDDSFEKLSIVANSSASSSPTAEQQAPEKQKSSIDKVKEAEHDLFSYIYLDKGLTTPEQKSRVTRGTTYLMSWNPLGASTQKYDMLDAVAIGNLRLYQDYVKALQKTTAGDSGSRTALLKKLKTIYASTSTGGSRFPNKMFTLVSLYETALKEEPAKAEAFVKAAQLLHMQSGLPEKNAKDSFVTEFVNSGETTPLLRALNEKIAKIDEVYKDGKPNRMDAKLNVRLVMLHENMPEADLAKTIPGYVQRPRADQKTLHSIEIMHVLHDSLSMLEEMRYQVGETKTKESGEDMATFMTNVSKAKDQLIHHRNPANAEELPNILKTTVTLCNQIEKFIGEKVAGKHPFDPTLANLYLEKVKTFADSPEVGATLRGSAEGLTSASEKKMQHK